MYIYNLNGWPNISNEILPYIKTEMAKLIQ